MKVILTAGYNQSLHCIGLMNELQERGHEVCGCLVVKTFQLKRIRAYLKIYGFEVAKKKFQSLVLGKKDTGISKETKYVRQFVESKGIKTLNVSGYCKENNIPHLAVDSLNTDTAVNFTKDKEVDFLIYAGGGILRKNIIESPRLGVLNAHSGLLPFFRGMNVIEWSLLYGVQPYTTIHFINTGIDTGKILFSENIPFENDFDVYDLRGRATLHNIEMLTKTVDNFEAYNKQARSQEKKDGKQFFVMHHRLKELINQRLIKDKLPALTEKDKFNTYNFK